MAKFSSERPVRTQSGSTDYAKSNMKRENVVSSVHTAKGEVLTSRKTVGIRKGERIREIGAKAGIVIKEGMAGE